MPTTASERDFISKYLLESRDRLVQLARPLALAQLTYKPAPGRWSIAENLEHITVVEGRGRGFVEVALRQAPNPTHRSGFPGSDESLIAMLRDRTHPRSGPEQIQPNGRWSPERLTAEFEASRRQTCELLAGSNADLRAHFSPHPLFGELDCYQWLLVLCAHCERHRAQCEEVMAGDGFGRASAAH